MGALVIMLAASAFWLFVLVEWRVEEVDRGHSQFAQRFRFLAAINYLNSLGIEAEQRNSLNLIRELSAPNSEIGPRDTIILVDAYGAINDRRLTELSDWIISGGTLHHSTQNPFFNNDLEVYDGLFNMLETIAVELELEEFSESETQLTDSAIQEQAEESQGSADEPAQQACENFGPLTTWQDGDTEFRIQMNNRHRLITYSTPSNSYFIADSLGTQLFSTTYGNGTIIYTTDLDIWNNYRIGCYDHAYLLSLFAQNSGKIWFLVNRDSEPLYKLIWNYYPITVLALIACLLSWLWQSWVRFGPIRGVWDTERRSLLEHTSAAANFSYRQDNGHQLIKALQDEIAHRVSNRARGFQRLTLDSQAEVIRDLTQLPKDLIVRALKSEDHLDEKKFTEKAVACQKVWNKL